MHKIIADYIYPISGNPISNGMLVFDHQGTILDLVPPEKLDYDAQAQYFRGTLCPGFINTHCHLELSYLKGYISQKTGLLEFIYNIQQMRNNFSEEEMQEAIQQADKEMYNNGIVAVGDISNSLLSKNSKLESKILYHTFVETFGFLPQSATNKIEEAKKIANNFAPLPASISPHAPYSVSRNLFEFIAKTQPKLYTIHNQENEQENLLYLEKEGDFLKFFENFGMDISFFEASKKTSLASVASLFPKFAKILLVHNTFSEQSDIEAVFAQNLDTYWALCPKANLYIEDLLPDVNLLFDNDCQITLGTDSLASNNTLSIWEELLTLKNAFPDISYQSLFKFATLNGATFLGIENQYGSFDKGKKPGIIGIDENQKVQRLK